MDQKGKKPETPASHQETPAMDVNDQIQFRLDKLAKNQARGELSYKNGLTPSHLAAPLHAQYDALSKEELEPKKVVVSVAGRIMMIRSFGKACFVQIKDRSGGIQLFVQKTALGDEAFERFKDLDIGDIVFCSGVLFKTKTNELSVNADKIQLVTKSLRPLPEKFHGIADVEIKYRQRYLDLITSDKTRETFLKRSKIVEIVRRFFNENDYVEVETPMMHPLVGGVAARPFITHHNTLDMKLYLRIAPELYLKRLVVGGLERVFEINRNFRNEGISIQHNPEFTMIEFYQAYATYEDLIPLTEALFQRIGREVCGSEVITYQGNQINLKGPWKRITVEDAILTGTDFKDRSKLRDRAALMEYGKQKHHPMTPKMNVGQLQMCIFEEEVEKTLIQPTFVTHYPLDVSPLSRKNEKDPFLVDRFEIFIMGREMGNAFSELNDPLDQKERFQSQVEAKKSGDEEACDMDEDYVRALEYGMPPAAGQGIGIDRMVMLFTDSPSIRDVILFPQLRKSQL